MGRKAHKVRTELNVSELECIKAMAGCSLCVSAAAVVLRKSRHTVINKCNKIQDMTGHDPRTFWGLVNILEMLEENE